MAEAPRNTSEIERVCMAGFPPSLATSDPWHCCGQVLSAAVIAWAAAVVEGEAGAASGVEGVRRMSLSMEIAKRKRKK